MAEPRTEALVKPDMNAVLSRTHLTYNLHGLLLPIFEAIPNAMDGIYGRFGEEAPNKGRIEIFFRNPNDFKIFNVEVRDNGVGLNDENYMSFRTPFTGYKLKQKGRGFGRFISFKVFERVFYESRYQNGSDDSTRVFQFDIRKEEEFLHFEKKPEFSGVGLSVRYERTIDGWEELIKNLTKEEVMDEIGSHFLPYFLYRWLPNISIEFAESPAEGITAHFKAVFVEYESGEFDCKVDGVLEKFTYSLTRINKTRTFKNHCLLFSAADRIVGYPRDLTNKLGQPHFSDDKGNQYIVIAVVRSESFEARLNDSRTSIDIPAKTIEEIVALTSNAISSKEDDQIKRIKDIQSVALSEALRENPILRLGLRGKSLGEYVNKKPNNWSAEEFVSDLAIERYRASSDLTKRIVAAASDREEYEKNLKDLVGKLDEGKKESLAEYVIHRKNIISLVESAQKYRENGRRAPEDDIHDLVFKRFKDSANTDYFEHNLWLIDDALAFLPYASSDRAMHGRGRKAGDKVSDLMFYDDSMILGDGDGTTLTIVEFKRPSRDDYKFGNVKSDPVLQVLETLEKAVDAGGIDRTDGMHISFSGVVRKYAFIIADITSTLVAVLKRHDFKNDWNPRMFVRYRDNEQVFIQAFGYDTLIEMAKKRNQAFFTVLFDE